MRRLYLGGLLGGPLLVLLTGVVLVRSPVGAGGPGRAYADHPPLAHTGGFGEPTCKACHFEYDLNAEGGTFTVEEVPEVYGSGASYRLTVRLKQDGMQRSGFMLAVRFASGRQAGTLHAADTQRVAVTVSDSTAVQYAHHTVAGTALTAVEEAVWILTWTAPAEDAGGEVLVHAAANAANDDASEFGDAVYTAVRRAAGR